MNAACVDQAVAERQTFRRIVIAADDERGNFSFRQFHKKIVEQLYRLYGRHRFIVYVARNQNAVRALAVDDLQNLRKNKPLIGKHRKFVYAFAEMQIG